MVGEDLLRHPLPSHRRGRPVTHNPAPLRRQQRRSQAVTKVIVGALPSDSRSLAGVDRGRGLDQPGASRTPPPPPADPSDAGVSSAGATDPSAPSAHGLTAANQT